MTFKISLSRIKKVRLTIRNCRIDQIGGFGILCALVVMFTSGLSSNIGVVVVFFSNVVKVHVVVTRL